MKALKIVLLIFWVILTFGLIVYGQMMKSKAVIQEKLYKESSSIIKEMSCSLTEYYENMMLLRNDTLNNIEIDLLFEKSDFLKKYEEKVQVEKTELN